MVIGAALERGALNEPLAQALLVRIQKNGGIRTLEPQRRLVEAARLFLYAAGAFKHYRVGGLKLNERLFKQVLRNPNGHEVARLHYFFGAQAEVGATCSHFP